MVEDIRRLSENREQLRDEIQRLLTRNMALEAKVERLEKAAKQPKPKGRTSRLVTNRDGFCRCCMGPIRRGDSILWRKDRGAIHDNGLCVFIDP